MIDKTAATATCALPCTDPDTADGECGGDRGLISVYSYSGSSVAGLTAILRDFNGDDATATAQILRTGEVILRYYVLVLRCPYRY